MGMTRQQAPMGFAVSEFFGSRVFIFPADNHTDGPPICTVHGSHVGDVTSDKSGNLYVPNGDGTIVEYAHGCGPVIATWSDQAGQPIDVAINGTTIYAANAGTGSSPGNVAVCVDGRCDRLLTHPGIALLFGIAVDKDGNVWAAVSTATANAALVVWPAGRMPGRIVRGYVNPDPAGLEIDDAGTLLSIDAFRPGVYAYTCIARAASCRKLGHWPLRYETFFGKLDAANAQFQAANGGSGAVDVYKYPGFAYQYSYDNSLSYGLDVVGITAVPN